jgi:protein-tyrosine phosphatase
VFRVLFVCTGNICRSPTAEGVFRNLVEARGLAGQIEAESAGIGSWHVGEAPDARSQQIAQTRGIDLSDQRARSVEPADFDKFDLILAMDTGHYRSLERASPGGITGSTAKIRLFMDYFPETGIADVPDPYYGAGDGFARVFDMIEAASKGLLAEIETRYPRDP